MQLVSWNTDAIVLNLNTQAFGPVRLEDKPDLAAFRGELHRIRQQVDQNLTERFLVCFNAKIKALIPVAQKLNLFRRRNHIHHAHSALCNGREHLFGKIDIAPLRLNPREFQDLADKAQHMFATVANVFGVFQALFFCARDPRFPHFEDLRETDDRIERGAKLMAH